MLIQQVPVVFGVGAAIWRHQPGERGNFRMDGGLRPGLEALEVSRNDFRHGQAMLLRLPLEELNFLAGQADCQCGVRHKSNMLRALQTYPDSPFGQAASLNPEP